MEVELGVADEDDMVDSEPTDGREVAAAIDKAEDESASEDACSIVIESDSTR